MHKTDDFASNHNSPTILASARPLQNTSPAFIPTTSAAWNAIPNNTPYQLPNHKDEIPYEARILLDDDEDRPVSSSSSDSEGTDFMPEVSERFKTSIKEWDFGQDEAGRRKSEIIQTGSPLLQKPSSSSEESSSRNQAGKVTIKPTYFAPLNTSKHAKADSKRAYFVIIEGFNIFNGKRLFKLERLCQSLKATQGDDANNFLYMNLWNDLQTEQGSPQIETENPFEPKAYVIPHMHFRMVMTVHLTHGYEDPFTFEIPIDLRQQGLLTQEKSVQNLEVIYSEPETTIERTGNQITLHLQLINDKVGSPQSLPQRDGNRELGCEYAVILKQIFFGLPLHRTENPIPILSPLITHGLQHIHRSNDVYAKRGSAINLGQGHRAPFMEKGPSSPMSWSNFSPEDLSPLQKVGQRTQRIPSDPQKPPGMGIKDPIDVPNQGQYMAGGSLFNFKNQQRFSIQSVKREPEESTAKRVNRIQSSDLSVVLEGDKSPLKVLEAYVKAVKGENRRASTNLSERSSVFAKIQHASTGLTENDLPSSFNPSSYGDSMAEIGQAEGEENMLKPDETLEEFKVEEYVGRIAEFAKTYQGSKVMLKYITTAAKEDLNPIVQEIGDKVSELMLDQYSSHIVQTLMQVGSQQQRLYLLQKLAPFFTTVARDKQGTHSLQAILAQLNTPSEFGMMQTIVGGTSSQLSLDPRANYVIQKLINIIPVDLGYFLYQPLFDNFVQVANNSFGLLVLKQMMTRVEQKETLRQRIVDLACLNFEKLVQNPYGNYALQHILEFYTKEAQMIMNKIVSKIIPYSSQKISSNVIEKCLAVCDSQFRRRVVDEIFKNNRLGDLMKNKYGNFVTLQLLATASDFDQQRLMQEVFKFATIFSGTKYKTRWMKFVEENPLKIKWSAIANQEEGIYGENHTQEEEQKVLESQEGKSKEVVAEKLEEVKKIWREMTKEEKTETSTPFYSKPKGKKNNFKKRQDNFKGRLNQPE